MTAPEKMNAGAFLPRIGYPQCDVNLPGGVHALECPYVHIPLPTDPSELGASPMISFNTRLKEAEDAIRAARVESAARSPERRTMNTRLRNLNPHKAALIAMTLYGKEYAAQRGGSMDFWEKLSPGRKDTCREIVAQLSKSPDEGEQP